MIRTAATPPLERALAVAALVIAVGALAAFGAVLIGTAAGVHGEAWSSPLWITVFSIGFWGLPAALLIALGLVVRRILRRQPRAGAATGGAAE